MSRSGELVLAARWAAREMRAGLKGFRIFLACLVLGVSSIAAVGSIAGAFLDGIGSQARELLGGDVTVALTHRPVDPQERAFLEDRGRVSAVAAMRSMARAGRTDTRATIELKAVDGAYPLFGAVETQPAAPLAEHLRAGADGRPGAIADPLLLDRLGIEIGDIVRIGSTDFVIRARLLKEPDAAAAGFSVGPRVLISEEALAQTGLVVLGATIRYYYRLALADASDEALDAFKTDGEAAFPKGAWQVRDRRAAAPQLRAFVDRISVFLTFVGLTALVVGGVGVGNGVRAYLASKTETIATLKCLGARSDLIFAIYLFQILGYSVLGIVIGIAIGAAAPFAVAGFLREVLPIEIEARVYPWVLLQAGAYGILIAVVFALWPLGRARELPPAALFRDLVASAARRPRAPFLAAIFLGALLLAGAAILFTPFHLFAALFVVGAIAVFAFLAALGAGVVRAAKAMPRPQGVAARLALANLHRPGAPTPAVVLSLGLGFTLLAGIALLDGNIREQVANELPQRAPALFFIDIAKDRAAEFDALVNGVPGVCGLNRTPNIRGRIVRVGDRPASEVTPAADVAWVLRGDQGLTFDAAVPPGSKVVAGSWWPADYQGPPLISLYKDAAEGLGLGVGDMLTINVLGREITAEIASLRDIDWSYVGFNFVVIFSPGALDGAPFMYVANVCADAAAETALFKSVSDAFPGVSIVRSREALHSITRLLDQLGLGVRATSAVTLIAGALVLAGALAAGYRARVYDSVILKVLGASRRRLVLAYLIEFLALGAVVGVFAAVIGSLIAWAVMRFVMEAAFVFLPGTLLATLALSAFVTAGLGLLATWRALGEKPAPVLRNL